MKQLDREWKKTHLQPETRITRRTAHDKLAKLLESTLTAQLRKPSAPRHVPVPSKKRCSDSPTTAQKKARTTSPLSPLSFTVQSSEESSLKLVLKKAPLPPFSPFSPSSPIKGEQKGEREKNKGKKNKQRKSRSKCKSRPPSPKDFEKEGEGEEEEEDGKDYFIPEYICDEKDGLFLVHWQGYTIQDRTWEPASSFSSAEYLEELIHKYHRHVIEILEDE